MKELFPKKKLDLLKIYMDEWIDKWPRKMIPFQIWLNNLAQKNQKKAEKAIRQKQFFQERQSRLSCAYCKRPFSDIVIKTKDHAIPTSRGGLKTQENVIPCCSDCNGWKADYQLEKWLEDVKRVLNKHIKRNKLIRHPYTAALLKTMIYNIKKQIERLKTVKDKVSEYKI